MRDSKETERKTAPEAEPTVKNAGTNNKVNNECTDAEKPHMGLTSWAVAPEGKF